MIRKFAHVLEYAILTLFTFFSSRNTLKLSKKRLLLLTVVITLVYAFSDEFHQTFVFEREGKIRDVLIDSIGISGALLTLAL